ncbi:MAG: radical SAM protein [Ignavibacteria bacterium GWB2_35_12]|nr:MAG: radical SAM protein [Ignavibacteria bacterium GWA2_35_8]OGU41099.1 MAG: radical SAM protein [Ignavibacteria bacterium GWB2_35_12]OGU94726.1 MAG: radical SAM protein [Ignavibacteria bacterium RIFOXYA2_FULL_35_10]OGV22915.1 MAG: radical SAM protein [Ignavibacteria bacterium RIFOXYC2_FULL_35_21]
MKFPIEYNEPLFRPPSEALSLIFQITIGCSWNKCSFCEMYTSKKFTVKKEEDVIKEIIDYSNIDPDVRKVFLADGNVMVLSSSRLIRILTQLNESFPHLRRISAYAMPQDIIQKSKEELKELYESGLKLLYIGIESGDDELLNLINKGETFSTTVESINKAQEAGIQTSVMIINGLGGKKYSRQHSINSARVVNEIQPHYLSTLVLSYPLGLEHYKSRAGYDFEPLNKKELFEELKLFIENTNLTSTIFRSDHASNYLTLKGILSRDKEILVERLSLAINSPGKLYLRPEWARGL